MAIETTARVTSDPSATTILARDVADEIRNLTPGSAQLLALVQKGEMMNGKLQEGQGLISKRSSKALRVEGFTHTPLPSKMTVTSVSSLDLDFADVGGIRTKQVWQNTANNTVGAVDAISTLTVSFITVGSTTFSATAGDVLQLIGTGYEEGSSSPNNLSKTDDNFYNVCQIFRYPVEIAESANVNPQLAGGELFARMKRDNIIYAKRHIENAMIWGERASSNNKTSLTTLSVSVPTMRGIYNWASTTYDAGGSMTPSKFINDMAVAMDDSVNANKKLICLMSKQMFGRVVQWQFDKLIYLEGGDLDKFGIKSKKIVTAQNEVEIIVHDSFNQGSNTNKAVIFSPEDLEYVYLEGRDLRINKNIQSPSAHTMQDELTGELCVFPKDGGKSIMKVTNLF